jgi:hypothetical protein
MLTVKVNIKSNRKGRKTAFNIGFKTFFYFFEEMKMSRKMSLIDKIEFNFETTDKKFN